MSEVEPEAETRPAAVDRGLEIEAVLGSLPAVSAFLQDAARASSLPYEVAFGLDLAAHEAIENVIRYAWEDGASHRIGIRFRCDRDKVEVEIADDGRAFDPLSVPAPLVPQRIEDVIPGGQGVHLMRHFTDEVRYRREGIRNFLTLVRAVPPGGGK